MTDIIVDTTAPQRTPLRFPEAHPDAHVSLAPDWRYSDVSLIAAEQLDRTVDDMLGRVIWDIFPGLEQSPMGTLLQCCMKNRDALPCPVNVRLPVTVDGIERDTCAVISTERRAPGGLYIVFRWASVVLARKMG